MDYEKIGIPTYVLQRGQISIIELGFSFVGYGSRDKIDTK